MLMTRKEIIAAIRAGKSLAGVDLQKASFQEANLQGADLRRANFQEADLQGADLQRASLQEANFQEADLQGAYLYEAMLQRANLQGANLQRASFYRANFQGASLQRANLQGADLQEADLRRVNLQEADLLFMYAYGVKTAGIKLSWIPKKGDLVRAYLEYLNKSALGILLEDPDPDYIFEPVSVRLHDEEVKLSITDMKPASRLEEIIQEELKRELKK
jgi:uncharacterized protein YjbI with pentapeptide repeats